MRELETSKPLANGGTLLQARTIFAVERRSDVHDLIEETGQGKLCYAWALLKFMWLLGLAECQEWLDFKTNPPGWLHGG